MTLNTLNLDDIMLGRDAVLLILAVLTAACLK